MNNRRRILVTVLGIALGLAALTGCGIIRRRLLGQGQQPAGPISAHTLPSIIETAAPKGPGTPPSAQTALQVPTEGPIPASMTWVELPNAVSNGTVCNDGSPAGYYIRRGTGAGFRLWIIHLQGGGLCTSTGNCDQRQKELPNFMSSTGFPPTRDGDGIMSASSRDNPDFLRANQVYVSYCSSDVWSGDREASAATENRHFRGARIVRAVVETLMDPALTAPPNLAEATDALFSGSSAGGVGVLVHLDWLAGKLPGVDVRGMTDAGWILDIEPYDAAIDRASVQFQDGFGLWNGMVDASCAAANQGAEGRCYIGPYVYSTIQTPLFVQISQSDGPQLNAIGITRPLDSKKEEYIAQFGAEVRASLANVQAAFSPTTISHGLLLDPEFWSQGIQGFSLSQVLGNWFFDRPSQVIKAIE